MTISVNVDEVVTYVCLIGLILLFLDNIFLRRSVARLSSLGEVRAKANNEFVLEQLNFNFGTLIENSQGMEQSQNKLREDAIALLEDLFKDTHSNFSFTKKKFTD